MERGARKGRIGLDWFYPTYSIPVISTIINLINNIMSNEEIEFAELEHKGGQHQEFQKNCPTCFSENLLVEASNRAYVQRKREELGRTLWDERHSGDAPSWLNNPLE